MPTEVSLVSKDEIPKVWVAVLPLMEKAVERAKGRYHVVDILTAILNGTQSLWIATKDGEIIGAATLSINEYPGGARVSRIEFLGGSQRDDWFKEMWDTMSDYSIDFGCNILETIARPGIVPYIQKYGGRQTGGFCEYDLTKRANGHQ